MTTKFNIRDVIRKKILFLNAFISKISGFYRYYRAKLVPYGEKCKECKLFELNIYQILVNLFEFIIKFICHVY